MHYILVVCSANCQTQNDALTLYTTTSPPGMETPGPEDRDRGKGGDSSDLSTSTVVGVVVGVLLVVLLALCIVVVTVLVFLRRKMKSLPQNSALGNSKSQSRALWIPYE